MSGRGAIDDVRLGTGMREADSLRECDGEALELMVTSGLLRVRIGKFWVGGLTAVSETAKSGARLFARRCVMRLESENCRRRTSNLSKEGT